MVSVADVSRGSGISAGSCLLHSVGSRSVLDKERLRLWEVWVNWWGADGETLREVEMMVRAEDWLWLTESAVITNA
tara:strand:- start:364 stop:591 length:228 start_codon:yes stop_codon:yes gene_type:complete